MRSHNRLIGLFGTSLTRARVNRGTLEAMRRVVEYLEPIARSVGFFDAAPFQWMTVSLRFGLKNEDAPHYERISKKYEDLPVAIELDAHEVQLASQEELEELFLLATLKTLVHVGKKYRLPYGIFADELSAILSRREGAQGNRI